MTLYRFFVAYAVSFSFLLLFFGFSIADAHGDEEHNELPSKVNVCHALSESEKGKCYTALCEGGVSNECAEDIIEAAVFGSGPKFALAVLTDISANPSFLSDEYNLARKIGQMTAQKYGLSGEIFSRCSEDFHYGCYYGFFEEVMAQKGPDSLGAAVIICDTLPNFSQKEVCYHEMGHMLLKRSRYDIGSVLSLCDSLAITATRMHCWDGVFMENVNEFLRPGGTGGGFLDDDPLAPCNAVDHKYREKCYGNHARYLLQYYNGAASNAISACQGAGEHGEVCIEALHDPDGGHVHLNDMYVQEHEELSILQRFFMFIGRVVKRLLGDSKDEHTEHDADADRAVGVKKSADMGMKYGMNAEQYSENTEYAMSEEDAIVIRYADGKYLPDTVHVSAGQRVVWVNEYQVFWPASDLHPTHKRYPGSGITKCYTSEAVQSF